jgi:hypothetical protein
MPDSDRGLAYRKALVEKARQRAALVGGNQSVCIPEQQQPEEDPDPFLPADQTIREAIRDVMENLGDKDWHPRSRIAAQILTFARKDEHEFMKTYVPHLFRTEKDGKEEDEVREHQRDIDRCLKRLDDWWEGQKGAACPT